ncbi:MAG: hypothetical protein GY793_06425 [Proteobacteria bacterium]|nr:hypothetical protein [Pseudomonadota bacterium]
MEILTDKQIKEKALLICGVSKRFEFAIVEYLRREKSGDLYVLSDFYDFCCEILNLDLDKNIKNYKQYKRKIQYYLKKLKQKGLIDWRRIGVGFLGKTAFGMTSLNSYTLAGFWD